MHDVILRVEDLRTHYLDKDTVVKAVDGVSFELRRGTTLGIVSRFALGKVLEQAGRYPPAKLEASYRRLLEADASIKSGIYRDELALEVLVQDLARMAAAPSPGRARTGPRLGAVV